LHQKQERGYENDNSSGIFDAVFMISPAIRTIIGYNSYHFPAQRLFLCYNGIAEKRGKSLFSTMFLDIIANLQKVPLAIGAVLL